MGQSGFLLICFPYKHGWIAALHREYDPLLFEGHDRLHSADKFAGFQPALFGIVD
jgi:hypothetical protein